MQTHTVTTYTAKELREQFPKAFEKALQRWHNRGEIFWQDETVDSLKALVKAAGAKLKDWNLGAYNRGNHISVEFPQDEAGELYGPRAIAWIENNLLDTLRVPWRGKERWELAKYGSAYRAGKIKPCPFTGYCSDDEYLDALRKSVRSGSTLKESFEALAFTCAEILERDCEDQNSPDYFVEHAEANDYQFTEDGKQF
jgi:hypothetical protein